MRDLRTKAVDIISTIHELEDGDEFYNESDNFHIVFKTEGV